MSPFAEPTGEGHPSGEVSRQELPGILEPAQIAVSEVEEGDDAAAELPRALVHVVDREVAQLALVATALLPPSRASR